MTTTTNRTEDAGAGTPVPLTTTEITRINISGDAVLTALNRLVDDGSIDANGKAAIWWFFGHCRDKGMSLDDAGKCIDRDGTTVHRLFHGRYGAGYSNMLADIRRYRKVAEERAKRKDIGFVETKIWSRINAVCTGALFNGLPAYIYGASQIGKTFCLEEFQRRNNHGQTRLVRMPAEPTPQLVRKEIARACYIGAQANSDDMRRRIFDAIDNSTLLVVDEFHQVFLGTTELTARKIVEFIREIYDRSRCGIVICGTKVVQTEFEHGKQRLVWDQFRRRGMVELVLPATPPKSDVLKIAAAFGLGDPDPATMETIREMLDRSGIGMLFKFLQLAHGNSVSKKETLEWRHFGEAYDAVRAMRGGQ